MKIRSRIVLASVAPVAVLALALVGGLLVLRSKVGVRMDAQTSAIVRETLRNSASEVRRLCELASADVTDRLEAHLAVARSARARLGPARLADDTVSWRAVSQVDGTQSDVTLPRMLLGDTALGQNGDPAAPTPLVDDVRSLVGGAATVFQRMGDGGDMLRIATTVPTKDGKRAIATFIPARATDGTPNPVISAVLQGNTFRGRAFVVDAWYLTAYDPLYDGHGTLVGMLFVGVRLDALESIRRVVRSTKIGATGDVLVLGGKGTQRGTYLVSSEASLEGTNRWDAVDGRGDPFVQNLIHAAIAHPDGTPVEYTRSWARQADRRRLGAVAYFEPWDWVIVASADYEEAISASKDLRGSLATATRELIALAAAIFLVAVGLALAAARGIARPIEGLAAAAERLAEGKVEQDIEYRGKDEIGRLSAAFRGTVDYLRGIANASEALAQGDTAYALVPRSEGDVVTQRFHEAQVTLGHLVQELDRTSKAAVEGRLDVRADPSRFRGAYARLVAGVNGTLDHMVAPVGEAIRVLERFAERDLEGRVRGDYCGDHARIQRAVNATGDALEQALGDVASVASSMAATAANVASASQAVAIGASQQGAVIGETSACVREMGAATDRALASTQKTAALAGTAAEASRKGLSAMAELLAAIQRIRVSSDSTAHILGDVNEIAFQTNLLALNAAVEAARAGDAGRGFAVVAEEVRQLALRSKAAAKKTAALVRDSVEATRAGEGICADVKLHLDDIVGAVTEVTTATEQIAKGSGDQSMAVKQVLAAIAQIEHVTQANSASAEQSTGAASELSTRAAKLTELVHAFRVRPSDDAAALPETSGGAAAIPPSRRNTAPRKSSASAGSLPPSASLF